jgi:hypothetical protein
VIANEFGEATGLHRSALFAAGLVLFVLTLLVNGVARLLVLRAGARPAQGTAARARRGRSAARRRRQAHERAGASADQLARFASARRAGARTGSPAR